MKRAREAEKEGLDEIARDYRNIAEGYKRNRDAWNEQVKKYESKCFTESKD